MSMLRDKLSVISSDPKEAFYICHSDRFLAAGDGFY